MLSNTHPARCFTCNRDAHRSGWQGHYYVAPAYDPGTVVFDHWTGRFVTVVAGAQKAGFVTVTWDNGDTCAIRLVDLTPDGKYR